MLTGIIGFSVVKLVLLATATVVTTAVIREPMRLGSEAHRSLIRLRKQIEQSQENSLVELGYLAGHKVSASWKFTYEQLAAYLMYVEMGRTTALFSGASEEDVEAYMRICDQAIPSLKEKYPEAFKELVRVLQDVRANNLALQGA